MSYTVERIINCILKDVVKPSSSVKDPCGICDKTVKIGHQAIQ